MSRLIKTKMRYPKRDSINFGGAANTYIDIRLMAGRVRFQNNADDVFYCESYKDLMTISKFVERAAKYLKQERFLK